MKQHGRWKGLGKAFLLLAAGATCLGSTFAQDVVPRLKRVPAQQAGEENNQRPIIREVNLSIDSTFRVAVVTRSGYYVSGARLTLTRHADGSADGIRQSAAADRQPEPVRVITVPGGPSVVMGIKPGSYQVRVEVRQKTSEAVLLVKAPSQDSGRIAQTQVLLPSPDDDDRPGADCAPADVPEGEPGSFRGCWGAAALGGAGLATAIALPLSLQRERRRASP